MTLPQPNEAIRAFFETVAHRCNVVDGSAAKRSPGLWLLDEAITHRNPFPRTFAFRKSFYALDEEGTGSRDVCKRVRKWLDAPNEEHVLNLFCQAPEAEAERFAEQGYQLSWSYDLFGRGTDSIDLPPLSPDLELRRVDSEALVDAINARHPEYVASAATLGDHRIHGVAVLQGPEPLAKGEIVLHEGFAHVMGMVTVPEQRRRGLGRRVLSALLDEARRRGAEWAVLNASLEATRLDFYPQLGFQAVSRCARLVRAGSRV